MPHIEVPDARIYYEEHGEGPPLLVTGCLHGRESFEQVIPILGERYRVIYVEPRHVGKSETTRFTYEEEVADVGRVMDALDIDRACLVGECIGSNLFLDFAARHPERVEALFMADPYVHAYPASQAAPEKYVYRNGLPRDAGQWLYMPDFNLVMPNGRPMLKGLQVPAFILYGDQDPMYQLPGFPEEVQANPAIPILNWPGVRHMEVHEPEEFAGIVLEFLRRPGRPIRRVWTHIRPSEIPPGVDIWC